MGRGIIPPGRRRHARRRPHRHTLQRAHEEARLATIPRILHEHINTAFPANVCLVGTVLPNGFAQITPRGSTMVYDDDHLALWERGKGSTSANMGAKSKVTVFLRKPQLREAGVLPKRSEEHTSELQSH